MIYKVCVQVPQGDSGSIPTCMPSCAYISQGAQVYVACECLHGMPPSLCSALGLHFLVLGKMGHEVGMSVSPSRALFPCVEVLCFHLPMTASSESLPSPGWLLLPGCVQKDHNHPPECSIPQGLLGYTGCLVHEWWMAFLGFESSHQHFMKP